MSFFYSRFSSAKTSNLVVDTEKVSQYLEGHVGGGDEGARRGSWSGYKQIGECFKNQQ